jgi:cyclase
VRGRAHVTGAAVGDNLGSMEVPMSWTRRDFVRASALGVAAAAFPRPLRLGAQPPLSEFTPLRRNVGTFTDRGGTIGWLVNNDGVLVVDSQFADTAEGFLQGLNARTGSRPIDALINTHHHGDHTTGNSVLRPAARTIVAHVRSAENQRRVAQAQGSEDQQAFPDTTFPEDWSMQVGDETVRAKYYGPAHTGGDSAIFFEQANIVHLGDLLNNRQYPNIDAVSGASTHGWISVLEQIASEHGSDTLYIFGHAGTGHPLTGSREDLYFQRDYFSAVVDQTRQAIREGRSREETASLERLPGFETFDGPVARLGLALTIAYDELTDQGS